MQTNELIDFLAQGVEPVPRRAASQRLGAALLGGLLLSVLLMAWRFGLRPDLHEALELPMFWVKQVFPMLIGAAAFVALQRLARPGVAMGHMGWAMLLPVLAIWALALWALTRTSAAQLPAELLGVSWRVCALNILQLSLPLLAALMIGLRELAPTRPRLCGAVAGALAGGCGAAVYALACIEMSPAFLAIWYALGMALSTALGALLGPRLLRW